MPRRSRIIVPDVPLHIIQRGNNRQSCFFADEDYLLYLDWLGQYATDAGCSIHAFVLMTNHVHLLLTAEKAESPGNLMKHLGQRYVQYINRTYKRSGTLWEGRYRSCIVQKQRYLLQCMQYIEMNPVRAEMVKHPADYRWSSFRANGQGEESALITHHSLYQSLGFTNMQRQRAYSELFGHAMDPGEIDKIRKATNGNFVLGNNRFEKEIGEMLGRRVSPGKAGRPRKTQEKVDPQI